MPVDTKNTAAEQTGNASRRAVPRLLYFCQSNELDYVSGVDWQQNIALGIVVMTAAIFVWKNVRTRSKKFSFQTQTHCGCSSGQIGPKQTIHFRARKGERPQVIVKSAQNNSSI